MAKFRLIHTSFWNDPRVVEEMTPEDKYFYLYLLTNENTTQIGIYQITKKQIAFDLGYSMESVGALLQRFEDHHKMIKYNHDTREIAIKNWGKYNLVKGGKPILDCVKSELQDVKDISLIPFVSERITNEKIKEMFDTYYESMTISSRNVDDTSTTRPKNEEFRNINGSYDTYHDTSTIRGQEKEEQEEEQEEKEEYKEEQQEEQKQEEEGSSSVSQSVEFGRLVSFYEQNVGQLLPVIGQELGYMFDSYKDVELIQEAFKIAIQTNAKNKMKYAEGILKNWKAELITSYDQLKAKEQREKKTKSYKSNGRTEPIPEWFNKRKQSQIANLEESKTIDFEAERQKMLAKLNGTV